MPNGSLALGLFVNDLARLWVKDTRPAAETNYFAQFLFKPGGLNVPDGTQLRVFAARAAGSTTRPFELRLRRLGGAWELVGIIRDDSGAAFRTGWYPVRTGWNQVVVGWQRAAAPSTNGGALAVWLNGVRVFAGSGIDNDTLAIDSVQLGILGGLQAGSNGVLLIDDFVSFKYPPSAAAAAVTAPPAAMIGQR